MNISVKRLAIICALVVALAAGCGGSKNPSLPTQLSDLPSSTSCDEKGISTDAARTGTCTAESTRITVANRHQPLSMQDYDAQVVSVRTADELGQRAAQNFTPDGKFVIVSLRVKNTGSTAQRFDRNADQAYLLVDGKEYGEVQGAEDELPGSFSKDGAAIEPGAEGTGTVVFDPPADSAKSLSDKGYVVFLDSNETTNGYPRLGFRSLGFIRLWK